MNSYREIASIARRFVLDIGLWYCIPAIFMAVYILGFSLSPTALAPHFLIVAMPLGGLVLARLAIAHWVSNNNLAVWIAAALTATLVVVIVTYYCVVIGGLRSWGGVISWNVIPSYAAHAPAYTETLGFSTLGTVFVAIAVFAVLVTLIQLYLRRFDWTRATVRWLSGKSVAILLVCGYAILVVLIYKLSAEPWTKYSEPVSLTFFQDPTRREVQGHVLNQLTAEILDRREDQERLAYRPVAHDVRKNLVLIVIDAQRSDHMGIYGYERDTTPYLSRLERTLKVRKVEFVHSSCPDTACGLLSLSSSKFPRQFSFRPFTLQQVMRRNGYSVHMILGGDHTEFYSLKEFYGEVDTFYDGAQADGYFMNDDQLVLDRLAQMPVWDGSPVMFQFHLMSTHMLGKHDDDEAHFRPAATYVRRFYDADIGAGSRQIETATNYYDNGVLKSDRMIDRLLAVLAEKGYLEKTLVTITADHGEGLGEHGKFVHMNSVREEVLRIPLLMVAYGYEPDRPLLHRPVPSQVDIAPTILAELGLPVPSTWSGRPLQDQISADFVFFESHHDFGLIDQRDPERVWKYWANVKGAEYAFNLSADPHEMQDALAQTPEKLRLEWRARVVPGTPLSF